MYKAHIFLMIAFILICSNSKALEDYGPLFPMGICNRHNTTEAGCSMETGVLPASFLTCFIFATIKCNLQSHVLIFCMMLSYKLFITMLCLQSLMPFSNIYIIFCSKFPMVLPMMSADICFNSL